MIIVTGLGVSIVVDGDRIITATLLVVAATTKVVSMEAALMEAVSKEVIVKEDAPGRRCMKADGIHAHHRGAIKASVLCTAMKTVVLVA